MMASRMKLEGRGSAGEFTATSLDEGELVALILLLFYMCYGAVRTMRGQLPGLTFGRKICQWCRQHEAAQRGEGSQFQRVETAPWARPQSSSMMVTQLIFGANAIVFLGMAMA